MDYEGINGNHSFIQDWSNIRGRFRGESPINRARSARMTESIDSWKNIWRKYLNTPHHIQCHIVCYTEYELFRMTPHTHTPYNTQYDTEYDVAYSNTYAIYSSQKLLISGLRPSGTFADGCSNPG